MLRACWVSSSALRLPASNPGFCSMVFHYLSVSRCERAGSPPTETPRPVFHSPLSGLGRFERFDAGNQVVPLRLGRETVGPIRARIALVALSAVSAVSASRALEPLGTRIALIALIALSAIRTVITLGALGTGGQLDFIVSRAELIDGLNDV